MLEVRPKTAKEILESFRENYTQNIKPLIEQKEYGGAKIILSTPRYYFDRHYDELLETVHLGGNFCASLVQLVNALESGNEKKIRINKEHFEAYLAQTTLPLDY